METIASPGIAPSQAGKSTGTPPPVPFDAGRLDGLMKEAGIDALVVTSKHNIQYLLGGYRFFFFDHFDAIGVSRYLPILLYVKGHPERAAYIGHPMESYERELDRFWVPTFSPSARMSTDGIEAAIERLATLQPKAKRIGIERAFLPGDAESALRKGLPEIEFVEAQLPLERLRAVKTPQELEDLRTASDFVVDSMLSVIAGARPGMTKRDLVEALRREEVNRGLTFEYCLITAGTSLNRAPSDQILREGDILSLDSGGNFKGYIGDLCRMAIFSHPDAELDDLLGEVDAIQQAARRPIRHGALGGDIYAAAGELTRASPHGNSLEFVAHGMGLISHEAPRLTAIPGRCRTLPMMRTCRFGREWSFRSRRRSSIRAEVS
jgi:Xaa-Pro aminopeptidase